MNLPMMHDNGPVTMSSREIADLCEKNHADVLRDIRVMLEQLGEVASSFAGNYIAGNGKQNPCFNLPKDLTLTLVAGYNVVLRKRIIDRWMELEAKPHLPDLSDPVVLVQLLTEHAGKRIEAEKRAQVAEAKAEGMAEDVAAYDRIARADGSLNITEAAKTLGMRPKDLFDWLARNGWIYKRAHGQNWLGYHTKCNQGLLRHTTTTVLRADGSEKITEQVRITAKGLAVLAKLIKPETPLLY